MKPNQLLLLDAMASPKTKLQRCKLGPDLHVLLDAAAKPPKSYSSTTAGSYVNLGELQKTYRTSCTCS